MAWGRVLYINTASRAIPRLPGGMRSRRMRPSPQEQPDVSATAPITDAIHVSATAPITAVPPQTR